MSRLGVDQHVISAFVVGSTHHVISKSRQDPIIAVPDVPITLCEVVFEEKCTATRKSDEGFRGVNCRSSRRGRFYNGSSRSRSGRAGSLRLTADDRETTDNE